MEWTGEPGARGARGYPPAQSCAPPDQAQRAEEGGWATVWHWLREAAPHLPAHRRFLRLVIQEARAEQEEPPAPGGRRGGRKPLLPFMLCWALPASRSLRSTGRAEPLPLGAAGGAGALPSPPQPLGKRLLGTGASWKCSCTSFLPTWLPPLSRDGRRAVPLLRLFLPPVPLPSSAEGEEQRRGMTHPALPGLQECGRGTLSLCPSAPIGTDKPLGTDTGGWMGGPSCAQLGTPQGLRGGHFLLPLLIRALALPLPSGSARMVSLCLFGGAALPSRARGSLGAPPALCQPRVGGPGVSGAGGRGDAGPGVGARRECGVL